MYQQFKAGILFGIFTDFTLAHEFIVPVQSTILHLNSTQSYPILPVVNQWYSLYKPELLVELELSKAHGHGW